MYTQECLNSWRSGFILIVPFRLSLIIVFGSSVDFHRTLYKRQCSYNGLSGLIYPAIPFHLVPIIYPISSSTLQLLTHSSWLQWLPCFSSNVSNTQDLCTFYPYYLGWLFLRYPHGWLPHFLQAFVKNILWTERSPKLPYV